MIHQEELFEKQDALAKLLCEYANEGSSIANRMVNLLPNTFRQEKNGIMLASLPTVFTP